MTFFLQTPEPPPNYRDILAIASIVVTGAWTIIGLKMKASLSEITSIQLKDRQDLVAYQNEVARQLTERHAETDSKLESHIARTDERFISVGRTLNRIDNHLESLARK